MSFLFLMKYCNNKNVTKNLECHSFIVVEPNHRTGMSQVFAFIHIREASESLPEAVAEEGLERVVVVPVALREGRLGAKSLVVAVLPAGVVAVHREAGGKSGDGFRVAEADLEPVVVVVAAAAGSRPGFDCIHRHLQNFLHDCCCCCCSGCFCDYCCYNCCSCRPPDGCSFPVPAAAE